MLVVHSTASEAMYDDTDHKETNRSLTTWIVLGTVLIAGVVVYKLFFDGWKSISPTGAHFVIQIPGKPEKKSSDSILSFKGKTMDDPYRYYGETKDLGGKPSKGWLPFTSWTLKRYMSANRQAEEYMVGYNDFPQKALDELTDREILHEVSGTSHLVGGLGGFPDPQKLDHPLPAVEVVFSAITSGGKPCMVTKRTYLSRKLGRAYVVIFAGPSSTEKGHTESVANNERFLASFSIEE